MNKNIKELALMAGLPTSGFSGDQPVMANELQVWQFANLLIQECMTIAQLNGDMSTCYQIKHHFGQ